MLYRYFCALAVGLLGIVAAQAAVVQKAQGFNADPGWQGNANRTGPQNFGYSASTLSAGGAAVGEIGGSIERTPVAWYADDEIGTINLATDNLSVHLTTMIEDDGNPSFGYFKASSFSGSYPQEALFFRIDDNNLYLMTRHQGVGSELQVGTLTYGAPASIEMNWTAATKQWAVSLNGGSPTEATIANISGMTIDRFGLFSLGFSTGAQCNFWIDDVVYTAGDDAPVGPTPSPTPTPVPPATSTIQRHEDFSTEPAWEAVQNRLPDPSPPQVTQNFGYSATNHAGDSPGEIGGLISCTVRPARYAVPLNPTLDMNTSLTMTGSFAVLQASMTVGWTSQSRMYIGWFNEAHQGWRPPNFIGFCVFGTKYEEPTEIFNLAGVDVLYGTQDWRVFAGSTDQIYTPGPTRHTFELQYDPAGNGVITLKLDGVLRTTLEMFPEMKPSGAIFNRFGIFNQQIPGEPTTVFFDDLVVNGVPYNFDSDPGWEGVGNHDTFVDTNDYATQDFGYSNTQNAGGEPGELGGRFWRIDYHENSLVGHYADPEIGLLSLDNELSARGKIAVPKFSVDSGLLIGWFNHTPIRGWPPRDFMGIYMDSFSRVGRQFTPWYVTSLGGTFLYTTNLYPLIIPDGRQYEWTVDYDPDAAGGNGAITLTLGDQEQTVELTPEHRQADARFDRFGVLTMQQGNGKDCLVYLDDLEYSVAGMNATKNWLLFQ